MAKARTDSETAKKAQALREAAKLGCAGAHRHPDGTWMACSTMAEYERVTGAEKEKSALDLIEETQKIRERKGSKRKRKNRQWEKLREQGVTGIDTLPGGGLVSGKGLTFRPVDGDIDVFDDINKARRRARQLGCIGVSRRTSRSGRRVWTPCSNMTDYARRTGSTALGRRYQDRLQRQQLRQIVREELSRMKRRKKRLVDELYEFKALGGGIGRRGARAARFDPNAWDGDNDGIVQEGTPYERPAIPGVNTNLPGQRLTRQKPREYPKDDPTRVVDDRALSEDEHNLSYYTDLDSSTADLEGYIPGRDQMEAELLSEGGMRSRQVDPKSSSAINQLDYDDDTEELAVTFASGQTYIYGGVTSEMVDDIESAPSIGKAINELKANATYVKKPDGTVDGNLPPAVGEAVADPDFPHPAFARPTLGEHTEMVPIEFFDEVPGNIQGHLDDDDHSVAAYSGVFRDFEKDAPIIRKMTDDLTEDIRANGIKEALMVNYNPQTGDVNLEEGNHRLIAARRLGMTHVPVRMSRTTVEREGIRGPRKQIGGMKKHHERYEHMDLDGEYLGVSFKPSQVGVPTRPKGGGGMRSRSNPSREEKIGDLRNLWNNARSAGDKEEMDRLERQLGKLGAKPSRGNPRPQYSAPSRRRGGMRSERYDIRPDDDGNGKWRVVDTGNRNAPLPEVYNTRQEALRAAIRKDRGGMRSERPLLPRPERGAAYEPLKQGLEGVTEGLLDLFDPDRKKKKPLPEQERPTIPMKKPGGGGMRSTRHDRVKVERQQAPPAANIREMLSDIDAYFAFLDKHHRTSFTETSVHQPHWPPGKVMTREESQRLADAYEALSPEDRKLADEHDELWERVDSWSEFIRESEWERSDLEDELTEAQNGLNAAREALRPPNDFVETSDFLDAIERGESRDEFIERKYGPFETNQRDLDYGGSDEPEWREDKWGQSTFNEYASFWDDLVNSDDEIPDLEREVEFLEAQIERYHDNGTESARESYREALEAKLQERAQRPEVTRPLEQLISRNPALNPDGPDGGMRSRRASLSNSDKQWLNLLQSNPGYWSEVPPAVRAVASDTTRQAARTIRNPKFYGAGGGMRARHGSGGRTAARKILAKIKPEHKGKEPGKRTLYYIGGTSGAGKSSVINSKEIGIPGDTEAAHIDPDAIKPELEGFDRHNPMGVQEPAIRSANGATRDALNAGTDVVYQSTGKRGDPIDEARQRGDRVVAHFVHVPVAIAEARVAKRYRDGGLNVPPGIPGAITRDLLGHWNISKRITRGEFDEFFLWDNDVPKGSPPKLIAFRNRDGHFKINDRDKMDDFFGPGVVDTHVLPYWKSTQGGTR